MYKVSVVVPVYNSAEYLEDCIDSLVSQTYENLEILLVDDGSTDRSPAICDKRAAQDDRIKVFHNEHSGVFNTRNFAYAQVESNVDMVAAGFRFSYQSDGQIASETNRLSSQSYGVRDALMFFYESFPTISAGVWAKLIRKEHLLKHLQFKSILEDQAILGELFCECESINLSGDPIYSYFSRPEGLFETTSAEETLQSFIGNEVDHKALIEKRFPGDDELLNALNTYYMNCKSVVVFSLETGGDFEKLDKIMDCKEFLRSMVSNEKIAEPSREKAYLFLRSPSEFFRLKSLETNRNIWEA